MWADESRNLLFIFGGSGMSEFSLEEESSSRGLLNDVWVFRRQAIFSDSDDAIEASWTWVSGSRTVNQRGAYGIKNDAQMTNHPGARVGAFSWNIRGRLFLFGGYGYGSSTGPGYLSDLWTREETGEWAWIGGPTEPTIGSNSPPISSDFNESVTSWPSARMNGAAWIRSRSTKFFELLLMGGTGVCADSESDRGQTPVAQLGDTWRIFYNFESDQWEGQLEFSYENACSRTFTAIADSPGGVGDQLTWDLPNIRLQFGGSLFKAVSGTASTKLVSDQVWQFRADRVFGDALAALVATDEGDVAEWPSARALSSGFASAQSLRLGLFGGASKGLAEILTSQGSLDIEVFSTTDVYNDVWISDSLSELYSDGRDLAIAMSVFGGLSGGVSAFALVLVLTIGAALSAGAGAAGAGASAGFASVGLAHAGYAASRGLIVCSIIATFGNRPDAVPSPYTQGVFDGLQGFLFRFLPPWNDGSGGVAAAARGVEQSKSVFSSRSVVGGLLPKVALRFQFDPSDQILENPEQQLVEGATFYIALTYVAVVILTLILWGISQKFEIMQKNILMFVTTVFIILNAFLLDGLVQDSTAFLYAGNETSYTWYGILLSVLLIISALAIIVFLLYIIIRLSKLISSGAKIEFRQTKKTNLDAPSRTNSDGQLSQSSRNSDVDQSDGRSMSRLGSRATTAVSRSTSRARSALESTRTGEWVSTDAFHERWGAFYSGHRPRYVLLACCDIRTAVLS
uniref:Uncharacterized protein n=1 Tax=Timspurckia oligopyrenoides TaxID=708627 RepID=A0A7S0ZJ28_9RHOD